MRFGFLFFIFYFPLQILANTLPVEKVADVPLVGSLSLQHYRLPNGLQVAIVEDDTRPVVTCQIAYRVGSAHEPPGRQGLAHLVEHLAAATYVSLGDPHSNASTSRDGTKYYATVPKTEIDTTIVKFARMMTQFDVSQEVFDTEKQVVLAEWSGKSKGARRILFKTLYAKMFAGHPYQFDGLGVPDTIWSFTLDQAIQFHKTYYVPNNACLVLVGDVKASEILPIVVHNFKDISKGEYDDTLHMPEPLPNSQDSVCTTSGLHGSVWGVWDIPLETGHPDSGPLSLFRYAVFSGSQAPSRKFFIRSGQALKLSTFFYGGRYRGLFYCEAVLPSGAEYEAFVPQIKKLMAEMVDSLNATHLLVARNIARKALYRIMTDQSAMANTIAAGFIRENDPTRGLKWFKNLDFVTIEEMKRVAQKYFLDQPVHSFFLVPDHEKPVSNTAWEWHWYHYVIMIIVGWVIVFWVVWFVRLKALGVSIVMLMCSVANAEIPNHKIYYVQDTRVPQTYISMVYETGGRQQATKETLGLHYALFRLYDLTISDENKKRLDELGAQAWISVSVYYISVRLRVFSENLDETLKLVKTIFENLSFSKALLNDERPRIIDAFEESISNNKTKEIFRYHLHKDDENRRLGSWEALRNLQATDIQKFWDQTLRSKVLYFRVISDLSVSQIEKSLEVVTHDRPQDGFSPHPKPIRKKITGVRALVYPYKNTRTDFCYWITNGIPRTDHDWFAQEIIVNAMHHMLLAKLREQKGWCYSAGVQIREWPSPPLLKFWADPPKNHTAQLVPEMFRLIHEVTAEPDFWQEIENGRQRLKRAYTLNYGISTRLSQEVDYDRTGVPPLSPEDYALAIDKVTNKDIGRVVRRLFNLQYDFQPKDMLMLFYGDHKRIKKIVGQKEIGAKTSVFDLQTLIR